MLSSLVPTKLLDLLYPPRCMSCDAETDQAEGLCGECWSEVSFISGPVCGFCGVPVLAEGLSCEDCTQHPPNWQAGRAAVLYDGVGRKLVLNFKHHDRLNMSTPLAIWLKRAGGELLATTDLLVPVPLHWQRRIKRGYNQSAELARALSKLTDIPAAPDALERRRATPPLGGLSREERTQTLKDTITLSKTAQVEGKSVILIDDVLTTGATATACTEALLAAGARRVSLLTLARVARGRDTTI
ncbi:MAG: ComF family protein [Pseudomonadota bacterium]